ncbi:hypothetical protein lerEdw1_018523 [Lerista edwardsae]|nr:hypothetical protein lerEdw1_018523 [Lerista edwardsae]
MSTAMNFGSKSFKPRPPDKGAFPLDHFGECKAFKEKFMNCLRENNFENALCRQESKEYLVCRMDRQVLSFLANLEIFALASQMPDRFMLACQHLSGQLMAKEPLEKLGFKDLAEENSKGQHEKLQ